MKKLSLIEFAKLGAPQPLEPWQIERLEGIIETKDIKRLAIINPRQGYPSIVFADIKR